MDQHPQQDLPVVAPTLTNHVFAHVGHGVELLLTDLAGELLLCIAVDNLVVLVERPELLEPFPTRHTLQGHRRQSGKQGKQLHPWKGNIVVKPTADTKNHNYHQV